MSASTPSGLASPTVPAGLVPACRELAARYPGVFSPETVVRAVYESYQLMKVTARQGADVLDHAVRFASDWLADAACERPVRAALPQVLFVCLHDTGRAQMAEALLRRRAGGRVIARSAGPVAGRAAQPAVVAAMAELGIGISREYPQPLLDDVVRAADVVVTMGCGDNCPVYLGKRYLDWQLPDPVGEDLAAVRTVRDRIVGFVEGLLAELTAAVVQSLAIPGNSCRDEAIRSIASSRPCPN